MFVSRIKDFNRKGREGSANIAAFFDAAASIWADRLGSNFVSGPFLAFMGTQKVGFGSTGLW